MGEPGSNDFDRVYIFHQTLNRKSLPGYGPDRSRHLITARYPDPCFLILSFNFLTPAIWVVNDTDIKLGLKIPRLMALFASLF
jgi:hypothetical protein